jgi:hypothetical protein
MRKIGEKGVPKEKEYSLEVMSTFDLDEDFPALGTAPINLNDASTINGESAYVRNQYYCRAIHNYGTVSVLIKYETFTDSLAHSVRINSGATAYLHNNVKVVRGSDDGSTSGALLNLKWIDRYVVDSAGPKTI